MILFHYMTNMYLNKSKTILTSDEKQETKSTSDTFTHDTTLSSTT